MHHRAHKLINLPIYSSFRDRPPFSKNTCKKPFKKIFWRQSVIKIIRLAPAPPPPHWMLFANFSARFWCSLPGIASSGLTQHWFRGKKGNWVTLSKSNVFLWTFLWKYSESHWLLLRPSDISAQKFQVPVTSSKNDSKFISNSMRLLVSWDLKTPLRKVFHTFLEMLLFNFH